MDAVYELGRANFEGDYKKKDLAQAEKFLRHAVQQKHVEAHVKLGHLYSKYFPSSRSEDIIRLWYFASKAWNIEAVTRLGTFLIQHAMWCVEKGLPGAHEKEAEISIAIRFLKVAAGRGCAVAQCNLAIAYEYFKIPLDDPSVIPELYKLASDAGISSATVNYGFLLDSENFGVERDEEKALRLYTEAANQGDRVAQYNLGVHYEDYGDDDQAFKFYTAAAEQGEPSAQFSLGAFYDTGRGTCENKSEARKWWTRAAGAKHSKACFNLGCAFLHGDGVDVDFPTAFSWLSQSDLPEAHFNLAMMHWKGLGTEKNLLKARDLISCASVQERFKPQASDILTAIRSELKEIDHQLKKFGVFFHSK